MNEISFFFNRGGIGCGDERRWRRIRKRTRILVRNLVVGGLRAPTMYIVYL